MKITLVFLVCSVMLFAKTYTIDATILGADKKEIVLEQKYISSYKKIATKKIQQNKVVFSLTRSQLLVGMKSRRYEDNAYNSS
jgi:hypothetical protein